MTENRILGYWCLGMVSVGLTLSTLVYCWEDHPDVAFVDHFVDFHIDYDRVQEDARRDLEDKRRHEENIAEWCRDLRFEGYSETRFSDPYDGSYGVPDRDR
jgi:hypothetical protein